MQEIQIQSLEFSNGVKHGHYKKFYLFIYFWQCWVCCCAGISLVAESGSYSLVGMCGLLMVVASLVAEHGP